MQGIERISDPNKKKLENDVFAQLAGITNQFTEPDPSVPKQQIKLVGFEDAIKELMSLYHNKS